jgi:hypothetical protein
MVKGNGHCQRAPLQINKVFTNGRLLRWPPFAKGSLSGSWDGICGSSGLRDLLPRLSVRRHNSWRTATRPVFENRAFRLCPFDVASRDPCHGPSRWRQQPPARAPCGRRVSAYIQVELQCLLPGNHCCRRTASNIFWWNSGHFGFFYVLRKPGSAPRRAVPPGGCRRVRQASRIAACSSRTVLLLRSLRSEIRRSLGDGDPDMAAHKSQRKGSLLDADRGSFLDAD